MTIVIGDYRRETTKATISSILRHTVRKTIGREGYPITHDPKWQPGKLLYRPSRIPAMVPTGHQLEEAGIRAQALTVHHQTRRTGFHRLQAGAKLLRAAILHRAAVEAILLRLRIRTFRRSRLTHKMQERPTRKTLEHRLTINSRGRCHTMPRPTTSRTSQTVARRELTLQILLVLVQVVPLCSSLPHASEHLSLADTAGDARYVIPADETRSSFSC